MHVRGTPHSTYAAVEIGGMICQEETEQAPVVWDPEEAEEWEVKGPVVEVWVEVVVSVRAPGAIVYVLPVEPGCLIREECRAT